MTRRVRGTERSRNSPLEPPLRQFEAMDVRVAQLRRKHPMAGNLQHAIFNHDFHVIRRDAGQSDGDEQLLLRLQHVNGAVPMLVCPRCRRDEAGKTASAYAPRAINFRRPPKASIQSGCILSASSTSPAKGAPLQPNTNLKRRRTRTIEALKRLCTRGLGLTKRTSARRVTLSGRSNRTRYRPIMPSRALMPVRATPVACIARTLGVSWRTCRQGRIREHPAEIQSRRAADV